MKIPTPYNEPIFSYLPDSMERIALEKELTRLSKERVSIKSVVNGKEIESKKTINIFAPHNLSIPIATAQIGDEITVKLAIESALKAKESWEEMSFHSRAAIFLKAADLISGKYRALMNATTMIGQGKNYYQSEIDAICELVDFLRFNVKFAEEIYSAQPYSPKNTWNRMEYRPLEGFVFAITPFNFTAIASNLCCAPALMGNTIVWKPSVNQLYSAHFTLKILHEAGLPAGVINMVTTLGEEAGEVVFSHKSFAGLHFTGSTTVFESLWKTIGNNISNYQTYPKIVGETGGKDFIVAHESANPKELVTAIVRGAFEYQGQKCSAASRVYIPKSLWVIVKDELIATVKELAIGSPLDFNNFVNAVIDEKSFDKLIGFINTAHKSQEVEVLCGGKGNKQKGYFIEPTILLASKPDYETMVTELFGPVVTIIVYETSFKEILKTVDSTSKYALTGAILGKDRTAIDYATKALRNSAGNFYINDKPTGAVVGQQPFGGGRKSGTNDKAGSVLNLLRWVSPRTIKENFSPPRNYRY